MPTNDPSPVPAYSTTTWGNPGNWGRIAWDPDPGIRNPNPIRNLLKDLDFDFDSYSEEELRRHLYALANYLDKKYPPKPPKFNSVEEADAWMEEHYG